MLASHLCYLEPKWLSIYLFKYVNWVILKRFGTILELAFFVILEISIFVILELSNFWRALRCPPVVPHRLPDNFWKFGLFPKQRNV